MSLGSARARWVGAVVLIAGIGGCLRAVDFEETCQYQVCGSECVDPSADERHCGACGVSCSANQRCVAGRCECTAGVACGSGCSDLQSDDLNCGACGKACPTGCKNGSCACVHAYCGSACVDLDNDPGNCGICGRVCGQAFVCSAGQCACPAPNQRPCNGKCIDRGDTETNCDCGPDTDGDGVCDELDPCPADAPDDSDGDGKCNSSDPCPLDKPDDTDGDGKCNGADPCPKDAKDDSDGDGTCDSNDPCPLDALNDSDGDGVCGDQDACPGHPDAADADGDGAPDACDPCPNAPMDDSDVDGVCDNDDICPLGNDALDGDADEIPDACDTCPVSNEIGDADGSGYPDVCEKVLFTMAETATMGPAPSPVVVSFQLTYSNQGQGGPCDGLIVGDDLTWTLGQTGTHTFGVTDDPDILPVLACTVNGINEWLGYRMMFPAKFSGGGGANLESLWHMGTPDLKGKTVTYLRLQVSSIAIETSGTIELVDADYTWQILGYEP